LALALDTVVAPGERVGEVVRQMLIELAVLLVADLGAWPCPQRLCLVDGLVFEGCLAFLAHADRESDVVRIAADQRAQPERVRELLGFRLQVELHSRATLRAGFSLDGELAVGARFPPHAALRRGPGLAREYLDAVGHDECRVEADAELPNELRVLLLIAGQRAEE